MEKQKKTEEELKDKIFDAYTKYHEASSSDRRQVYLGQLWDLVTKWCRFYRFVNQARQLIKEAKKLNKVSKEMESEILKYEWGVEIFEAVKGCAEKDKMPKNVFFPYLYTALVNKINEVHRKCEKDLIRPPRGIIEIRKDIRDLKKMWRSEKGREIKDDEIVYHYSILKQISVEEARAAYLESIGKKFIPNTSIDDDGKELNILEEIESHYLTPNDEIDEDIETKDIKDALETVLNGYEDEMEPFYRALFTVRCIKKYKNYQRFLPIFNAEILEMFKKNGKIPAQYEIYMKYHPNAEKSTAEANASQMSKKFFADLNKAIKEKDPEIEF